MLPQNSQHYTWLALKVVVLFTMVVQRTYTATQNVKLHVLRTKL